jgi:hypothetical protein
VDGSNASFSEAVRKLTGRLETTLHEASETELEKNNFHGVMTVWKHTSLS